MTRFVCCFVFVRVAVQCLFVGQFSLSSEEGLTDFSLNYQLLKRLYAVAGGFRLPFSGVQTRALVIAPMGTGDSAESLALAEVQMCHQSVSVLQVT